MMDPYDDTEIAAVLAVLIEEDNADEIAEVLMDALTDASLSDEDRARIAAEVAVWLMP